VEPIVRKKKSRTEVSNDNVMLLVTHHNGTTLQTAIKSKTNINF